MNATVSLHTQYQQVGLRLSLSHLCSFLCFSAFGTQVLVAKFKQDGDMAER